MYPLVDSGEKEQCKWWTLSVERESKDCPVGRKVDGQHYMGFTMCVCEIYSDHLEKIVTGFYYIDLLGPI